MQFLLLLQPVLYKFHEVFLFELILERFKTEREKYNYYMNNLNEVDDLLKQGATKAGIIADGVLNKVREKLGFEKI